MKAKSYDFLCIDFETKDPYVVDRKMGSGWVYKGLDFKVLGIAIVYPDMSSEYIPYSIKKDGKKINNREKYKRIINKAKRLIVYNANYDIGILHRLGIDIEQFEIVDVAIMAKMNNSAELGGKNDSPHSLNFQAKKYLKDKKSSAPLGEAAKELGLVKTSAQDAVKAAMSNMDIMQEERYELVAEYAIHDAVLTYKLFELFKDVDGYDYEFYSDLIKANILSRARGVPVDLIQLSKLDAEFQIKLMQEQLTLNEMNGGQPLNSGSPPQVAQALISHGANLKKNEKGNYICDSDALEELALPIAKQILRVREIKKLKNDFIGKIIDIQRYTMKLERSDFGAKALVGIIYPEINIFGAAATGRCSASGPNIQQIPSRGGEESKLIRTIFIPHEEDNYISACDFSAQEPRLIINDAAKLKAEGIQKFIDEFNNNPDADFHAIAATEMGVERNQAKQIGLALLYGMGLKKLAAQLSVSVEQAKVLRDKYFECLPFMEQMVNKMSNSLLKRQYIKTIGGNKLRLDPAFVTEKGDVRTMEYKALNKRIQGSAAYQTNKALVDLYRAGIPYLFPVHDEIVASIKTKEEGNEIQRIMENAYKLVIPSVAEVKVGQHWAECK